MNAQNLVLSAQEFGKVDFMVWLKRQIQKFTRKTPRWVEEPSLDLDFEAFKSLVEGAISAPMVFQKDPIGFYAQGSNFSIEMEEGAMRCYLRNREVTFRKLIAEL